MFIKKDGNVIANFGEDLSWLDADREIVSLKQDETIAVFVPAGEFACITVDYGSTRSMPGGGYTRENDTHMMWESKRDAYYDVSTFCPLSERDLGGLVPQIVKLAGCEPLPQNATKGGLRDWAFANA